MADEAKMDVTGGFTVSRIFEQPPDALVFYADFAQIIATGAEIIMQFYETIPGAPGPGGKVTMVRSRLRATVVTSPQHATTFARLILQQADTTTPAKKSDGKS